MDLDLSDTDRMVQKAARDFADGVLAPRAAQADSRETYCEETIEVLRKPGYLGLSISEEHGGAGMSTLQSVLVNEEVSRACLSTSATLGIHSLVAYVVQSFGTEEQKQQFLMRMASGEEIGAFALTEAGAGSDPASIAMRAERQGDDYVINGAKQFITNGGVASLLLVFAKTDPSLGVRGVSAFLVSAPAEGLSVASVENKMGIRGSRTAALAFADVRVPKRTLVGKEGDGLRIAMAALDHSRPGVGSQGVGLGQAALDLAIKYAKERVVFGQPISEFQNTRFRLADMATRLEAARLMVYRAAILADKPGVRFTKEASMAKLFATEAAHEIVDAALQIHGGYGYMKDYTIERLYRDQRVLEIYEGTSEILRTVIASALLR